MIKPRVNKITVGTLSERTNQNGIFLVWQEYVKSFLTSSNWSDTKIVTGYLFCSKV